MKSDNVKSILIILITNLCILITLLGIVDYIQYKNYVNNVNNVILKIVGSKEEDVAKILNDSDYDYSKSDLSKYGIYEESAVINSMNTSYKKNIVVTNIMVIVIYSILSISILLVINKYNKRIEKINNDIKNINEGNYQLNIQDNCEGELSKLQNELYKITVKLKEEANKNEKQTNILKEHLEDISHQIKNPITSMGIMLDLVKNDIDMDNETRIRFLRNIEKQKDKIELLILNLLKLARLDTGTVKLKKDDINVKELLSNVKDSLSALLDLKNINLNIKCNKNIKIIGDKKWEEEAIINILKNCIEHMEADKSINIRCIDNPLYTKIIVKDEGHGIAKEDIKNIFDRFYIRHDNINNFGIGLSLSKKIIEQDNGYIKVSSKKGKGTIFTIKYIK